ncbi:MAG: DUF1553 domain-containing protein [Gemmataceae bacterium]
MKLSLPVAAILVLLCTVVHAGDADELARYDAAVKAADRKHWAFQPVKPRAVPAVKDRAWASNPVDAFVKAKLEGQGWSPAPLAEKRALLRRVYLDVTGVPPTLAEQEAFLNDSSPDAWERMVERLLGSPHYGERWGRHWLDVVRYAETNGYERDAAKPNVWRYRDYVIRSFNADKPFDRFILEQLAGDELPDATAETVIATGYYRLGPWDDEPADPKEDRFDQLEDIISTTSQAFLGLTMGCARCHNHKFEPLTMHDYYRMVAIFDPLQRPVKGRDELDRPAVPHGQPTGWFIPAQRGYFMEEPSPKPPKTHLLIRGSAGRPGPKVEPGLPTVLAATQPPFLPPDKYTTRRRLMLARWIASKDNPLTARVIVNRVWQHHFGEGLVRTPNDFGTQGQEPTHPELLDWLAGWFVDHGWSVKALHRLILTSYVYRMSRQSVPQYAAEDPETRLLWRMPYHRLDVETIRDSVLAVSGRLNLAMFGPGVLPPIPKDVLAGNSDPDKVWRASDERSAAKRTIYVHTKRTLMFPLLDTLDFCDTARTAARRNITTVAPQALTLFNGDFVNEQAKEFAARLDFEAGPDLAKQIDLAYRLTLCRPARERERQRLLDFLAAQSDPRTGREQLCRVILNLNEFVYPD